MIDEQEVYRRIRRFLELPVDQRPAKIYTLTKLAGISKSSLGDIVQGHVMRPERLRRLANQQVTRGVVKKQGKVVLLAGILGSEITVGTTKVWFSPFRIFCGNFDELQVKRADTSKDKLPYYPAPPLAKK